MRQTGTLLPAVLITAALFAGLCTCTANLRASADKVYTAEDVFAAMDEIDLPAGLILSARNDYASDFHDENGMTINGVYESYEFWTEQLLSQGRDSVLSLYAKYYNVSVEELLAAYVEKTTEPAADEPSVTTATTVFVPSVVTQIPFREMSLAEKQDYVNSLPEDERAQFLATLSKADRNSFLLQISAQDKADFANGIVEIGDQMGMHVSVDTITDKTITYSVRDDDGALVDEKSIGLNIDPTGWNTTLPVLCSSGAILLAAAGFLFTARGLHRKGEKQHG